MPKDDRDVLEVMKAELDFIEKGGYGRSVRTPWKPTCIFQDSPTCLNFDDPKRTHSCDECLLMEFVPPASRTEQVPCHQIPLTLSGETLAGMEQKAHQDDLEEAVKNWLHTNISRIEAVRAQFDASLRLGPEKLLPPPSDRKRLLVVDDDEQMLIALERLLEDAGYDTTTAWSGQEALRLLRQRSFDFILLDDYLPGVTTEEILRQLQRMPGKAPVVIMQSSTLPDDLAANYARLGACYFLRKREPKEIVNLVDKYFSHSHALPTCA
jgi:CheY-like chemotaxis protein